jgi:hypothetical protein
MACRIWFNALRAGSGTAAKYSSTVCGARFLSGEAFVFAARRLEAADFAAGFESVFFVRRRCGAVRWAGFFMP